MDNTWFIYYLLLMLIILYFRGKDGNDMQQKEL